MQTLWIHRGTREGGPKTGAENEETLEKGQGCEGESNVDKAEEIHRSVDNEMGIVMGLEDRREWREWHALFFLLVHLPIHCLNIHSSDCSRLGCVTSGHLGWYREGERLDAA